MATLGRTGIETGFNGFGALPIQRVSKEDAARLLRGAYDGGVTFFDTARAYTDSEEKIAHALADVRGSLYLASKTMARTADALRDDLHESLRQLRTDYLDLYQLHNPPFCPRPGGEDGLYDALLEAKRQGKIRHIGITSHLLHIANEAVASGLYETLQFPFSYLSSGEDIALYEASRAAGMGFLAMKGLCGGILTNARAACAWLARYPDLVALWGIQRESELAEFLSYIKEPPALTPELAAVIEADRERLSGDFCRGCGYCMPCPAGIEIYMCARMIYVLGRMDPREYLNEKWQAEMAKIEDCLHCDECKKKCPYQLDTPALLEKHYAGYKQALAARSGAL